LYHQKQGRLIQETVMLTRGSLPNQGTEAHTSPLAPYKDLWVVCVLVAIGLAVALGLAVAHPMSIDLSTSLAQFGG
jgi:hypothetical protein